MPAIGGSPAAAKKPAQRGTEQKKSLNKSEKTPVAYRPKVETAPRSESSSSAGLRTSQPKTTGVTQQPKHAVQNQQLPFAVQNQQLPFAVQNQQLPYTPEGNPTAGKSNQPLYYAVSGKRQIIPLRVLDSETKPTSSLLNGPWKFPALTREKLESTVKDYPENGSLLPIFQQYHPGLSLNSGDGECRGVLAGLGECLKKNTSSRDALKKFDDIVRNNPEILRRHHLSTRMLLDKIPEASDLTSKSVRRAELNKLRAGGLSLKNESKEVKMVQGSPDGSARAIFEHLGEDGYYIVHLSPPGSGLHHVIAALVSHWEQHFLVIDPNGLARPASSHSDLCTQIEKTIGEPNYDKDYSSFDVRHHELH